MNRSEVPAELVDTAALRRRPPYPSALGISLTERCNIRCSHCIFACTGHEARTLERNFVERVICEASLMQELTMIGFTGGEPFLEIETLASLTERCRSLGLRASVTTNAYWARNVKDAIKVLQNMPGITRLGVSCDHFHQEFIPIEKVRNAICACSEAGVECGVRVSYLNDPAREIAWVQANLDGLAGLYTLEHQPVQPMGRAGTDLASADLFRSDVRGGCCLSVDSPYMDLSGNVFACCGPAACFGDAQLLFLGNAHESCIADLLSAAKSHPVIAALRVGGPALLMDIASDEARRCGEHVDAEYVQEMCSQCEMTVAGRYAGWLRSAIEQPEVERLIAFHQMAVLGEVAAFLNISSEGAD